MTWTGWAITVSLFTREWIEIVFFSDAVAASEMVSLFTREWIEIPMLTGMTMSRIVSLFTREWIEISRAFAYSVSLSSLPLYEGVD